MINKEHKLTTFLDGFRVWLDLTDFNYIHREDDDFKRYVIKFDMGKSLMFIWEISSILNSQTSSK